jgi:hypothetical protein
MEFIPNPDIEYDEDYPLGYRYKYPILPKNVGDYVPGKAYKVFEYVKYFHSIFRSRKNDNILPPAGYDPITDKIYFNVNDWKLIKDNTDLFIVEMHLGYYDNNPEYVKVTLDASSKILYGVQKDGNFYFGAGIPKQIDSKMTQNDDNLQRQINSLVNHDSDILISVSPRVIFKNASTVINIVSEVDTGGIITPDTHVIKRGDEIIDSSNNLVFSTTDELNVSENITYTSEVDINGIILSKSSTVTAVDHIYYGSGKTPASATIVVSSPKTSPAGKYTVNVAQAKDYIYFDVPNTMSITSAKVNGFDMPLTIVTSSRANYKCYQSVNTYDAGPITIDIQ